MTEGKCKCHRCGKEFKPEGKCPKPCPHCLAECCPICGGVMCGNDKEMEEYIYSCVDCTYECCGECI